MGASEPYDRKIPCDVGVKASRKVSARRVASYGIGGAAQIFAALGDSTRLGIVARLSAGGPQSIAHLAAREAVTRQAITKHLRVLERAGVARSSRAGREQIWELRTKRLSDLNRYLNSISSRWDAAIGRLRALVEMDTD